MRYDILDNMDEAKDFRAKFNANGCEPFFMVQTPKEFAEFARKSIAPGIREAANQNWKAHINIHPDDLVRAWSVLYPLLHQKADMFKVVNIYQLKKARERLQEHKKNIKLEISRYNALSDDIDLEERQATVFEMTRDTGVFIMGSKDEIDEFVLSFYRDVEIEADRKLEELARFLIGVQITLYIAPGSERASQELLQEIEDTLTASGIRPGTAYKTDRELGPYCSIRHPGAKYQPAVSAESYNPDKATDPFKPLLSRQCLLFEIALEQQINQLEASPHPSDMNHRQQHNATIQKDLADALSMKKSQFSCMEITEKLAVFSVFRVQCYSLIREADSKLICETEWGPFCDNLRLLQSPIGVLFFFASMAARVQGRYLVFDSGAHIEDEFKGRLANLETAQFLDFDGYKPVEFKPTPGAAAS